MKIDVTEYEKKYTFELAPITQLHERFCFCFRSAP